MHVEKVFTINLLDLLLCLQLALFVLQCIDANQPPAVIRDEFLERMDQFNLAGVLNYRPDER